ncbi:MAG: hypothetical protein KKB88_00365 [Nanoarchaeota archaeon]|nr:hypothetical protein [Nanoarchaeota archaeon]
MKNKIYLKGIFCLITLTFFISFITATITCSPNSLSTSFVEGSPVSLTTNCYNSGNNSVTISKNGNFFNLSDYSISPSSSKTISINIYNINYGTYSGSIDFSDSSSSIPLLVLVQQQPLSSACQIDIFPTIMNNIKVQQGETKSRNIQVNVPSCYPSYVNLNGVILASDEKPIQLGEMNLGQIQPGTSINIPIEINAENVAVGTYQDTLSILAYNSSGNKINLPSVSISVLVSSGITPMNNFSLSQLPSCSLSSTILNLNNTYSVICTKNNPNIMINPIIDTNYITGISVEETSTQYVYNFRAKNIGVTNVSARFTYANAEIGERFSQECKITASGTSGVGGIILDFIFYQGGESTPIENLKSRDTIITLVDNSTRNIITSPILYLNGVLLTNNTQTFEINKNYELRATAYGYSDKLINFNVSSAQITISLDPSKEFYLVGDLVNFTSDIENVSYLFDDLIISSPYTFLSEGIFILKATKDGYVNFETNITIKPIISYNSIDPVDLSKWKKGDKILMKLTEECKWYVYFKEEYKQDSSILYKEQVLSNSGIGSEVSFEIKKNGYYEVKAVKEGSSEEISVLNQLITNQKLSLGEFWNNYWGYILSVLGLLIGVGLILIFTKNKSSSPSLSFGGSPSSSGMEGEVNYDD